MIKTQHLEPVTTPIFTPIFSPVTGETPQQGGSTMTIDPMNELQRSIDEGPTSYATVYTQSVSAQTQQLTMILGSTTPPTVNNVSGVPVISQSPPLNQMAREQAMAFQTPPFVTKMSFNTTIPPHPTFMSNNLLAQNPHLLSIHPMTFPFQQQSFYGPTPGHLSTYNNMLVQPYLTAQQYNPQGAFSILNRYCLS
ncbi:unnamed protein product [Lactuca virosa]|uniref:Uncharacterized protein n=1 Tax=Lactuca virosa TaxID=75947 RepID=A0AAU9P9E4_9ASTR|nr:unnamed protein product [Lactuca virosa]